MGQAISDRETFAGVLLTLVRERSTATGASKTSRTGLQASVPVSERPGVRRGLDALLEHGLLAASGEDIGLTGKGKLFMAHVQRARGQPPVAQDPDDKNPAVLAAIVSAIEADDRLAPQGSMDDVRTLPARLEGYRAARAPRYSKGLLVLGGLAAAAVAFALLH
ncbi:hypothetical protein [Variovorax saccharolyticus]|uniref:hypothetical protein n=1 Tax=Variovorax saccharolyticus TaxID=3053516 RepID=UPI002575441F|nr:hypothetical protein [Variovorax sp. J31P216]MDM0023630.1 hypothetical protein [Variovorax sp. J31P216]